MINECISREAAIDEIDKWLDAVGQALVGKGLSYYGELIGCIEDVPKADAEQVVYCKDCCYCKDGQCVSDEISRRFAPEPYDYCSCGKLKGNGGREG